jgi:hypothetical protein
MKQDWQVKVYKTDKRFKVGERFVSQYPFSGMDREAVERELKELANRLYPKKDGWRFDVQPATMTVKSLMTGANVEIPVDTPWCCNPASESFWSN